MSRLFSSLPAAIRHWKTNDPIMARLAETTPARAIGAARSTGFSTLVVSLIHQQVSLAAGRSITRNVVAACGGRITPAAVLGASPAKLRAAGLSRQKRSYVLDLAHRTHRGEIGFRRFAHQGDDAIIETLTKVRGIGPWTAKMFLVAHLQRPDVVAPEDLGLRLAAAQVYGVPAPKAAAFLEARRAAWSPFGTLACLTLWAHKDQAPSRRAPRRSREGRA
ncbi:MAG TPA: DNA-3-methyladenine glycosylase 2 family protein [Candidatus Thermoplasmatota archaeon]|nr:DNA-3-methyladenine glycosylase 2 family protein [Candidatus Thermoplasmatota archaeon]